VKTIHLTLNDQAAQALRADQANESLHRWLIEAYFRTRTPDDQATLFSQDVSLADDILPLLDAVSQVTHTRAEELIEAWAREFDPLDDPPSARAPNQAEADELIDLLQTLFEEVVEDTRRRPGPYPEAEQVLDAAGRLFDALRRSLGDRSAT